MMEFRRYREISQWDQERRAARWMFTDARQRIHMSRWDSNISAVNRKLHEIRLQKYEFFEMLSEGCFRVFLKEIFSLSHNFF